MVRDEIEEVLRWKIEVSKSRQTEAGTVVSSVKAEIGQVVAFLGGSI